MCSLSGCESLLYLFTLSLLLRLRMSRRQKPHRQSSLPSSLIPHLYDGPQLPRNSSTRTTLPADERLEEESTPEERPTPPTTPFLLRPIAQPLTIPGFHPPPIRERGSSYNESHDYLAAARLPIPPDLSRRPPGSSPPISLPPIHGDPIYYSSPPRVPAFRSPPQNYPPPTPFHHSRPVSLREGEAGPSSMAHGHPLSGIRDTGSTHPNPSLVAERYDTHRRYYPRDVSPRGEMDGYRGEQQQQAGPSQSASAILSF